MVQWHPEGASVSIDPVSMVLPTDRHQRREVRSDRESTARGMDMTYLDSEQFCECGDRHSATGNEGQRESDALNLVRDAIKRELESELRGLLMAARFHRLELAISGGKPVVTDSV
jgi:hypothetical protein